VRRKGKRTVFRGRTGSETEISYYLHRRMRPSVTQNEQGSIVTGVVCTSIIICTNTMYLIPRCHTAQANDGHTIEESVTRIVVLGSQCVPERGYSDKAQSTPCPSQIWRIQNRKMEQHVKRYHRHHAVGCKCDSTPS
jgi:hypothetical protein